MTQPRLERRYDLRGHRPMLVDIHLGDCDCAACEGIRDPEPDPGEPAWVLVFLAASWLAGLGTLIASAIASIDFHGAWLALATMFGGGR